ncbi:MAG: hypothetical protein AB8G18_05495 [Gammaproteobacteria bacterium]
MTVRKRFFTCAASCLPTLTALLTTGCSPSEMLVVTPLDNPAQLSSQLPNLADANDNTIVMSWVHKNTLSDKDSATVTYSLHTSRYSDETGWSSFSTVATGPDWFVNWADFPSVYSSPNGALAAHWLRRSGDSTYAYDVMTSQSIDGVNWSEAESPHFDGTQTEHGFASFYSLGGQTALVWLDGRNTESSDNGHADHAKNSTGAMTLRTRVLTSDNHTPLSMSTLLDERVCDCCQTAAANTNDGAVVFYRDRSDDEIRDISYVRFNQKSRNWSLSKLLHQDGWKIEGCPVNGPQADASGALVAVAWFTAVPTPRVQLAVSIDNGASFSLPIVVSKSSPLGRVDVVALSSSRVLVSWLEQEDGAATVKTRLFNQDLETVANADVATIGDDRRSGFPRMAALDNRRAMISWTNWTDNHSTVSTALITAQ